MYKTKDSTPQQLQAIRIKNQDEIKLHTGEELNLVRAWELIRDASDDFTKSEAKAQKADALLFKLLQGQAKGKTTASPEDEILQLQEKERARALALLELELLIAA